MTKRINFSLAFLFWVLGAGAQNASAVSDTALYLRFPFVPPFQLYRVPDSTVFAKADLKKKKATLLIIFSPECDHCLQETNELKSQMQRFKKVQIVMASWLSFAQVKQFYHDYGLASYPNVTVGWDKAFMLPPYFKLNSLPFMALYDKKGQLIKVFSGQVGIQQVAEAFE